MPANLTPLSPPAPDALLVGDPRRAFTLAQALMVQPRMSHQARGLWGYTGETEAGHPITVQSTGPGAAAAIAVIGDLAGLGVRRVVRAGTCVGANGIVKPESVLTANGAIPLDGAGHTLTGGKPSRPDPGLVIALEKIVDARPVTVSSHDFVSRYDPAGPAPAEGAAARDLQTAATLAFSRRLGLEAAAILVVAGIAGSELLGETELEPIFTRIGPRIATSFTTLNLD